MGPAPCMVEIEILNKFSLINMNVILKEFFKRLAVLPTSKKEFPENQSRDTQKIDF
jgi:hypothetical protein